MTDKREVHDKALGKVSGGNIFDDIVDVAEDAVGVVTEPAKEVYDTVSDGVSSIIGGSGSPHGGGGGGAAVVVAPGATPNSPTQTTTGAGQNNSNNSGVQQNNVDGPNSIGGSVNLGGK